ncbi:MAG: cytidylate kinase [Spirochaetales bacterium]|nr:MAG: cytidylate kinase [Spirochaetales bacterium]
MSNKNTIAISGKSGCGNTTVSRLVAEAIGLRIINYTFHTLADERNMDFKSLCLLAEKDPQFDYFVDEKQMELARGGQCVLGSRLAIWLLKDADLKVYLTAAPRVRAQRIFNREGGSFENVSREMAERDARDTNRYKRLYGIDNDSYTFADLVIDTDNLDQNGVAQRIIEFAEKI